MILRGEDAFYGLTQIDVATFLFEHSPLLDVDVPLVDALELSALVAERCVCDIVGFAPFDLNSGLILLSDFGPLRTLIVFRWLGHVGAHVLHAWQG